MRRFLIATVTVGGVMALLAAALLSTLRAQASGPLPVSAADMLSMGTLASLRVPLVAAGGTVARLEPDGVLVFDRHNHPLPIIFARGARFLERGSPVTSAAIEPGAHLAVLGLRSGASRFLAASVRISPHHHAIGGLISRTLPDGLLTLVNRHGSLALVKIPPHVPIALYGRPFTERLRAGLHLLTLSVPDPRFQEGVYVAETVRVLLSPQEVRVGGLITAIDRARHAMALYSKSDSRTYTVEATAATKITLNKWKASMDDMLPGDHLTVVGRLSGAARGAVAGVVAARIIRISSPSFSGTITAIAATSSGGRVLTVRGRHGHLLRITAPGRTPVVYDVLAAHVLDLAVGQHVVAHGARTGKFALTASTIHVYPHQYTVGGTVASLLPGLYRIVAADGRQYLVHTTARTLYTAGGKTTTADAVAKGLRIRVHGYDALHNDQKGLPTVIAGHVTVLSPAHHTRRVHHTTRRSRPVRHKSGPPATKKAPLASRSP